MLFSDHPRDRSCLIHIILITYIKVLYFQVLKVITRDEVKQVYKQVDDAGLNRRTETRL